MQHQQWMKIILLSLVCCGSLLLWRECWMYISWCVSLAVVYALGNVFWPEVFNNSSTSVTNHFYFSLRKHIYIERNMLTQPDAYPHINTHIYEHIYIHAYKYSRTTPCNIEQCFFYTNLSVFLLSLISFGIMNDWESLENTATDVSGIHLSLKPQCVSVHVCFCKCQNKETVQWIFNSSTLPLPCSASQCWPLNHAGMHSKSTDKHKQKHTHTPVQSAGVVVDSEGLVCRGFVPERPPCKHTCRQDLKPCCTPASPPLSPGTTPAHKQAPH